MTTKLFSETDIGDCLDFERSYETLERTYIEMANGRILNPSKLTMHMGDDGGWPDMNAFSIDMPAYVDWLAVAGMKWAVATWDADTETPISSLILLFDLQRGAFKAVLEGMYLTGARTAMQSVVGIRHLHPDSVASIGVLGTGFQARFQLLVIDQLTAVERFEVFDIDTAVAREFASEMNPQLGADVVVRETPGEAVENDVVLTVTDSKTPVLEDDWLDETELLIALGSYRELPDETILDAERIIVDHREQCLQRGALSDLASRDGVSKTDLDATIGEVLAGEYTNAATADGLTLFVPIGLGSLDIAIAEQVYRSESSNGAIEEFDFV